MQRLFLVAMATLAISGGFSVSDGPSTATAAAPGQPEPATSTLEDQNELALTVYNSDLALVRDVRTVRLPRGEFDLRFMDIAATVNPATVHLRSLTEPARLDIVEQNYEYDLLEPDKILRKYVGRDVILVRPRQQNGTTAEEVKARLLSYNEAPVWQIGNEIVTGLHADHMRFPELPGNLYVRPTLIWSLDNRGTSQHRVQASYLASSLNWNADYVLTVSRDEKHADVDGWVTLVNNSGTAFRNAKLQLVAGDLNRVREAMRREMDTLKESVALAEPAARMSQEAFSDYHLYTLKRKTSINNKETKQVSMLAATGFPVRKRYVVDGQSYYYRNAQSPGSPLKDVVKVYYQLKNEAAVGLGMPMPAGVVRVYQADSNGSTQFVGEDRIAHTPKDETLNLRIGAAFDVVAERKQVDFRKIAGNVYEMEFEVVVRNHKTVPVTVEVNEPLGGTWRIQRASHEWTKPNAWAAQFNVPVRPDGAATLNYRVQVTY